MQIKAAAERAAIQRFAQPRFHFAGRAAAVFVSLSNNHRPNSGECPGLQPQSSERCVSRIREYVFSAFSKWTGGLFFLWTAARSAAALFFRPRACSGFRQGCKGDCPRKAAAERAAVHFSVRRIPRRVPLNGRIKFCSHSCERLLIFAKRDRQNYLREAKAVFAK